MTNEIHFEQFVEEIRIQYPLATTIVATEQPLRVSIDGQAYDPTFHIASHKPFHLTATPQQIKGDGVDYTTIRVVSLLDAGQEVTLAMQQGDTVLHEAIQLDGSGKGELEICTQTTSDIIIWHPLLPVRVSIHVIEA